MSKTSLTIALLVTAVSLATYSGCRRAATIDPAVLAKHQAERVLTEQPADPVGIQELCAQLRGDDTNPKKSTEAVEVALLGQLGSGHAESVFTDGRAAFTMIDPAFELPTDDAEHDHEGEETDHADQDEHAGQDHAAHASQDHASEGEGAKHETDCACHFCESSKVTIPQAVVTFVDEDGEALPIDARELFGLDGEELVVVTGSARLSVGQLMVTADKLYVRE